MIRLVLTLGAVLAWIFGGMLLLAPGPFFAPIGVTVDKKVAIIAQNQGAALIAIGLVNFLSRGVTDAAALRSVLLGNLVIQLLSLGIVVRALALGIFPPQGVPAVVIHVVLATLFALALRRVRTVEERTPRASAG